MGARILVADDEPSILLSLSAILEMNGYEVVSASSAKDAILKLQSDVFDIVLTDMRIETETAGYDVVRAAKKVDYQPAVAILTAYPSRCSDWRQQGADVLLEKPMSKLDPKTGPASLSQPTEISVGRSPRPVRAAQAHPRYKLGTEWRFFSFVWCFGPMICPMRRIYKIVQEVLDQDDAGIVRDPSESPDKAKSLPPTRQPAAQSDAGQEEASKVKQG